MALTPQEKLRKRERRRSSFARRCLDAIETLTADGESYADITPDRLAEVAGLSRATLYNYFGGKGGLLKAGFRGALREMDDACVAWREIGADSSQADVRAALEQIMDAYLVHATLIGAINDEATQDSTLRDALGDVIERCIAALRTHIECGQREGWVDRDLLAADTATWCISGLERGLNHVLPKAVGPEIAAVKGTLADIAWHTLYAEAPIRRGPQRHGVRASSRASRR
jgi:TetR/AcrR family transcriptional regulator, ethionamide resistance regulator